MKILLYFGHPAQYLFLRETIKRLLKSNEHQITILIKSKDVLEDLVRADDLPYTNILREDRGKSKLAIGWSLVRRLLKILPLVVKDRPDLLVSTDASLAQLGFLLRINRITITEDDYEVIKNLADLTYPFTQTILCPRVCDVGRWSHKKAGYEGYMKLGYLHPHVFKVNLDVVRPYNLSERFLLIRLARLTAHHDFGIKGISAPVLRNIIQLAGQKQYRVYISSEGRLDAEFGPYQLHIKPSDLHQVLAQASLLVCDSQSMSVEAAMLGVPSIRFSDFAGRISVLEELEHTYRLTYGIATDQADALMSKIRELLSIPNLRELFCSRRKSMLDEKIDVTAFLVWFIENYPGSRQAMRENPRLQERFK
jgi:uncharacterized protein